MIPAPRPTAVQSSSPRGLWLLVVVLAFWVAQMHGFAHGVSHLGRANVAPHAALCSDCLATADAGAAPTPAGPVAGPASMPPLPGTAVLPAANPATTVAAYRSRAPPRTT